MENVACSPKELLEGSVGPSRGQVHPVMFKLLLNHEYIFPSLGSVSCLGHN